MSRVYDSSGKQTGEDEEQVLEEGLRRGNKSWEWCIYDKTLECEQKGIAIHVTGRIVRIEWKLKNKEQIKKHLKVSNPVELQGILGEAYGIPNPELEKLFNQHIEKGYLRSFARYGQRLPKIPQALLEAL